MARTELPQPGPVHLNVPLRKPLEPWPEEDLTPLISTLKEDLFFAHLTHYSSTHTTVDVPKHHLDTIIAQWSKSDRGVIIAGIEQPADPIAYSAAILKLAHHLKFPILAEGLSPLRHYDQGQGVMITNYHWILRSPTVASSLNPEVVIRIGELPTSVTLRNWLQSLPLTQWCVTSSMDQVDPLGTGAVMVRTDPMALASHLPDGAPQETRSNYQHQWQTLEQKTQGAIAQVMEQEQQLMEPKVSWLLSQYLEPSTPIFIANSMSVRHVEYFWQSQNHRYQLYCNRGANGIDGTLSTALGIAYDRPGILLTGDLALLHDTNGLLNRPWWPSHLTMVVINNGGGGIFEMLPIAQFEPPFETYFAMDQGLDLARLAHTYQVDYELIHTWAELIDRIQSLPRSGIRLLEIKTSRKYDSHWLKHLSDRFERNF